MCKYICTNENNFVILQHQNKTQLKLPRRRIKSANKDMATERYDINGQMIGNGDSHCAYNIEEFPGLPIKTNVQKSLSSESVYVTYLHMETLKLAKVRFSSHTCNDVEFGAVIDGHSTNVRNEILYKLGLVERRFVPAFSGCITFQNVAKKKMHLYEVADKTIAELSSLPAGTDISEYRGKIAKDSSMVITSSKVISKQIGGHFEYIMK